jgi:hypothetical protein
VAILFLVAFFLCLRSGFRGYVFAFVMVAGIAFYLSMGLKSLWLALAMALMVGVMVTGHGNFFELPPSVQRTLSIIPGNWDPRVLDTTRSSNDFRQQIRDIYLDEYADQSPLIGNGFNYKRSALYAMNYEFGVKAYGMTPYDFHKGFIQRKDFHIGWISLYDSVGVGGGVFFMLLFLINVYLLYKSYRFFPRTQVPPILIWVSVMMGSSYISFFVVFGAFQQMLPLMCVLSALTYLIYEHVREQKFLQTVELAVVKA